MTRRDPLAALFWPGVTPTSSLPCANRMHEKRRLAIEQLHAAKAAHRE
jgi:hypothetical protein